MKMLLLKKLQHVYDITVQCFSIVQSVLEVSNWTGFDFLFLPGYVGRLTFIPLTRHSTHSHWAQHDLAHPTPHYHFIGQILGVVNLRVF